MLSKTFKGLGGVLGAYAGFAGFSKVISDVSTLEQINARIGNLTGDLANEQQFLKTTAKELSTEYVNLANSYSKLLPLQQAGLLTSEQSRVITKGLANVQATAGASAAQLGQTMFGLSQGLSAGTLRAEELNQVTEPMPGLLQALDRASGLAAGGFRKLVVDGQITSDMFRDTLIVALKDYEGNAAALGGNINQSFTRVRNEYTNLIQALQVPINSALVPFANALEGVLSSVAENADEYISTLGTVATATALAFGARAVGEAGQFASAQVSAFAKSAKAQKEYSAALKISGAANAKFDAERVVSSQRAAVAEAEGILASKQAEAVRLSAIASKKASIALTAESTVAKKAETLAEIQQTLAINQSTLAEARRSVSRAEAGAIAATTNAVRLKHAQNLEIASLAEAQANTVVTNTLTAQTAAEGALAKAKAIARGESGRATTASIAAAKASSLERTATQGLAGAQVQLNAAKVAGVGAATALATAETAAAAATVRQTIAMRAQAIAAAGAAAAMRGLSAATALVGGPVGVAIIAAYGIYKFVESLDVQDTSTNTAIKSLDEIAGSYRSVGDEAEEAAQNTIALAEAELEAATVALKTAEIRRQNNPQSIRQGGGLDEIDSINRQKAAIAELAASIAAAKQKVRDEGILAGQAALAGIDAGMSTPADIAKIRSKAEALVESIFPNDAKIAELRKKSQEIRLAQESGFISASDGSRSLQAINLQIKALKEADPVTRALTESQEKLKDQTEEYQQIVSAFDPNQAAYFELEETTQKLEDIHKSGAISAIEYQAALFGLNEAHKRSELDERIEKERELRDLMNQDVDFGPIDSYADSMLLLNRALEDTPEKTDQIQAAIARLNSEFASDQSGDANTAGDIEAQFAQRSSVIQQYRATENADIAATNAATLALEAEKYDALQALETAAIETRFQNRVTQLQALRSADVGQTELANEQIVAAEAQRYDAMRALELDFNNQRAQGLKSFAADAIQATSENSQLTLEAEIAGGRNSEAAEAAHQARLKAIKAAGVDIALIQQQYDQGLISLDEYHAQVEERITNHQGRVAELENGDFLQAYDREIGFANQLFDLYQQRSQKKTDAALTAAKEARKIADSATGDEKAALEEQAVIAEQAARRRFQKEKKASIAQARVQQALAVVKAWTSGATIYDQIANAAVAFAGTEAVIQDLKSQQFNGGSPLGGSGGDSGGSSGSGSSDSNTVNGQDIGAGGGVTNVYVLNADDIIDDEKLKARFTGYTAEMAANGVLGVEEDKITVNTVNQ